MHVKFAIFKIPMNRIFFSFFFLAFACGKQHEGDSSPSRFFDNATRRNPTAEESSHVVRVNGGCTAFFVNNSLGKTYLASARHCFNYNITQSCANGFSIVDNNWRRGSCVKVIASNINYDIAIFEAKFNYSPSPQQQLTIAAYQPAVNTPLLMIGYPADKYRNGILTVTENCWVLKQTTPSPYSDTLDRSSLHNCSTYGGNSGGPMLEEGTDVALGLPFSYFPGDNYKVFDGTKTKTAAHMAQLSGFVEKHRTTLEKAGVIIAE